LRLDRQRIQPCHSSVSPCGRNGQKNKANAGTSNVPLRADQVEPILRAFLALAVEDEALHTFARALTRGNAVTTHYVLSQPESEFYLRFEQGQALPTGPAGDRSIEPQSYNASNAPPRIEAPTPPGRGLEHFRNRHRERGEERPPKQSLRTNATTLCVLWSDVPIRALW
jgi:hypothetical protein